MLYSPPKSLRSITVEKADGYSSGGFTGDSSTTTGSSVFSSSANVGVENKEYFERGAGEMVIKKKRTKKILLIKSPSLQGRKLGPLFTQQENPLLSSLEEKQSFSSQAGLLAHSLTPLCAFPESFQGFQWHGAKGSGLLTAAGLHRTLTGFPF